MVVETLCLNHVIIKTHNHGVVKLPFVSSFTVLLWVVPIWVAHMPTFTIGPVITIPAPLLMREVVTATPANVQLSTVHPRIGCQSGPTKLAFTFPDVIVRVHGQNPSTPAGPVGTPAMRLDGCPSD
jgi:hypothetical protein